MTCLLLILAFCAQPGEVTREDRIRQLTAEIARSGRVLQIETEQSRLSDPRKQIAPGKPPMLSFRYFVGADRHRFGKLDLMLDDAGH